MFYQYASQLETGRRYCLFLSSLFSLRLSTCTLVPIHVLLLSLSNCPAATPVSPIVPLWGRGNPCRLAPATFSMAFSQHGGFLLLPRAFLNGSRVQTARGHPYSHWWGRWSLHVIMDHTWSGFDSSPRPRVSVRRLLCFQQANKVSAFSGYSFV